MTLFLGLEWFSLCLYILVAIDTERETSLEAGLKYLDRRRLRLGGAALRLRARLRRDRRSSSFAEIARGRRRRRRLPLRRARDDPRRASRSRSPPRRSTCGRPTCTRARRPRSRRSCPRRRRPPRSSCILRVLVTAFPEQSDIWTIAVAVLACDLARLGEPRRARAARREAAARVLVDLARRLHADGDRRRFRARRRGAPLLPRPVLGDVRRARSRSSPRASASSDAPVTLESLAGLGWERPYHGIALWIFMLGMAGFPLTGGMFGKLFVFSAAYDAGDWWLVLVGVAATAVSLAYYLNVVRWMYMRSGAGAAPRPGGRLASARPCARRRDRCGGRRHRRLVLRRPADPRRRVRRSRVAPLLREDVRPAAVEDRVGRPSTEGAGS